MLQLPEFYNKKPIRTLLYRFSYFMLTTTVEWQRRNNVIVKYIFSSQHKRSIVLRTFNAVGGSVKTELH